MEKKKLILKMQEELQNYQIGLHNISLNKYALCMCSLSSDMKEQIKLTEAVVSEKTIAEHIFETGLYMVSTIGLRSTVSSVKELNDTSLDYFYYKRKGPFWNVIVAIPYFLNYGGTDYFIGDFNQIINIANTYLFNPVLPKEFIYGYYYIDGIEKENDIIGSTIIEFGDEIEFFPNPYFIEKLDNENKALVFKRIWEEKANLLDYLKLASSDADLRKLIRPLNKKNRNERIKAANLREIIEGTREQGKRLFYGKR